MPEYRIDDDILSDLLGERIEQNEKWARVGANWDEPDELKLTVLVEEVGEVAKAVLEHSMRTPQGRYNLYRELIQVAAVAIAWAESIDVDGIGGVDGNE